MPTFVIERELPGAGKLTQEELRDISQKSCSVVESLGVPYTWHHSYVTADKIYCVHETDESETVREHARRSGFPSDSVAEVATVIGPRTAEE